MTGIGRRILDRFPEQVETIRKLFESNANFNSLCQEFEDVNRQMNAIEDSNNPVDQNELRNLCKRSTAIEEVMLVWWNRTFGYEVAARVISGQFWPSSL